MNSNLLIFIDNLQNILGYCPCCSRVFLLTDAKLIFAERKENNSEYGKYLINQKELETFEQQIEKMQTSLSRLEEKHEVIMENIIEKARERGRKRAKSKLKKIDTIFSGRKIDPQDVKVIFDPIEYVVFNGMHSGNGVKHIELIGRMTKTKRDENIEKNIIKTIKAGNYEFKVLRIDNEGLITFD
jgi:predicted Holliday junction resolvase-like endonuclease